MSQLLNHSNLIRLLVLWFSIGFLSIRHSVHITLYSLLLLFIYDFFKAHHHHFLNKKNGLIFLSLSGIFLATLIQQTVSWQFNPNAFDGPSRLLIAGLVFLYLYQKNINYIKLIEISIPAGLIFLYIYLQFHTEYFWGQRWANSFVDPNSMGGQTTILALICLLTLSDKSNKYLNLLKILGAFCGLYISTKAESRGGWATLPFMTLTWLIIQIKASASRSTPRNYLIIIRTFFFLVIGTGLLIIFNHSINTRLSHTTYEITTWFKDPLIYTSTGSRMSMWVSSIQLIFENWFGYGEIEIKQIVANHPLYTGIHQHGVKDLIQAGPHSDFLSKGLSLGILGIVSYLALIFTPFLLFFKNITHFNQDIKKAASTGLLYTTGIFIAGLFNETLSLKYLCTFYGLMIACLAAQILRDNSRDPNQVQ